MPGHWHQAGAADRGRPAAPAEACGSLLLLPSVCSQNASLGCRLSAAAWPVRPCRHHHHGLGGGGCCGSGGTPPADATHPAGGAGCAAGAACCAAPTQRWFLSAGPAADLEMGGSKGWERVREGEEAVHSGLVPILAAAGYAQDSSSSSSGDANSRTSSGPQAAGQRGSGTAAAAAPPALAATPAANLNLRGAVIHCIGDLVQSIGVCVAGALIWWHQVRANGVVSWQRALAAGAAGTACRHAVGRPPRSAARSFAPRLPASSPLCPPLCSALCPPVCSAPLLLHALPFALARTHPLTPTQPPTCLLSPPSHPPPPLPPRRTTPAGRWRTPSAPSCLPVWCCGPQRGSAGTWQTCSWSAHRGGWTWICSHWAWGRWARVPGFLRRQLARICCGAGGAAGRGATWAGREERGSAQAARILVQAAQRSSGSFCSYGVLSPTLSKAGFSNWTVGGAAPSRLPAGRLPRQLRRLRLQVPGVAAVADLHVWALTPGAPTLVCSA